MDYILAYGYSLKFVLKKENVIYAILKENGAVVAYEMETKQWKFLFMLPMDYRLHKRMFVFLEDREHKLYFFTQKNFEMLIYDLEFSKYEELKIFPKKNNDMIASVIANGDNFFYVPFYSDNLVVFNRLTRTANVYSEWKKELINKLKKYNLIFLKIRIQSTCIMGRYMYSIANCETEDIIFSICLDSMKLASVYRLNIGVLFGMEKSDDLIWIQNRVEKGSRMVCWNPKKGIVERITDVFEEINDCILEMKISKGLLCASFMGGKVLLLNEKTLESVKLESTISPVICGDRIETACDGRVIKIVDFGKELLEKIIVPDALEFQCFIKWIDKEKKVKSVEKNLSAGKLIFDTLSGSLA